MWMKAEEVPKEIADEILEWWDQTEPALQRMIFLQVRLDLETMINALREAESALNFGVTAKDIPSVFVPAMALALRSVRAAVDGTCEQPARGQRADGTFRSTKAIDNETPQAQRLQGIRQSDEEAGQGASEAQAKTETQET